MSKFESPIEGLSQDDFEFAVAYIAATEFNHRAWYVRGKELAERNMTGNDLFENDDGRLSEILTRFALPYESFRAIVWSAVVKKHELIQITEASRKRSIKLTSENLHA